MTTDSQPLIDCRNVQKMFPDPAGVPFAAGSVETSTIAWVMLTSAEAV